MSNNKGSFMNLRKKLVVASGVLLSLTVGGVAYARSAEGAPLA